MRKMCIFSALLMLACSSGREALNKDVSVDKDTVPSHDLSYGIDGGADLLSDVKGPDIADIIIPLDGGKPELPFKPSDLIDLTDPPDFIDVDSIDIIDDFPVDLSQPPAGCCNTSLDCPLSETGEPMTCVTEGSIGWPSDFGVCVEPAAIAGWCYVDSQCPAGQICHGSAVCGCQMDCYWGGPGICAPADGSCAPVQQSWVQENCNAASIVIFDGQNCVQTCPGCCDCFPFCDLTFQSMQECKYQCLGGACAVWDGSCDDAMPDEPWWYFSADGNTCLSEDSCVCEGCPGVYATQQECEVACKGAKNCDTYIGALADCPYFYFTPLGECPWQGCLDDWCESDVDCPMPIPSPGIPAEECVFGNCVYCWQDVHCGPGEKCRAGRCVSQDPDNCLPMSCTDDGCQLVTVSENPCPVCLCESFYPISCSEDTQCMVLSLFPFKHCVYGRCAECRNDSECTYGNCLPPGICYEMTPNIDYLYGTWLVGWAGGMDHFSYFRFEPDGTLRRGSYQQAGAWSDDVPPMPCWPDGVVPSPLIGTWEPEITQSGFLVVRIRLNISCDSGEGWTTRFVIYPTGNDGISATFDSVDSDLEYMAWKVPTETCEPDFSTCDLPQGPW